MYTPQEAKNVLKTLFGSDNPRVVDLTPQEWDFVTGYANPIVEGTSDGEIELMQILSDRVDQSMPISELGDRERDHRIAATIEHMGYDGVHYAEDTDGNMVLIFETDKEIAKFNRAYCQLYMPFLYAVLKDRLELSDWQRVSRKTDIYLYGAEDLADDTGYADSWDWCSECGKAIYTQNTWRRDYHLDENGYWCVDCIRRHPEDYLDLFVNRGDDLEGQIDVTLVDPLDHGWQPLAGQYVSFKQAATVAGDLDYENVDFIIVSHGRTFSTIWEVYVLEKDFDRASEIVEQK